MGLSLPESPVFVAYFSKKLDIWLCAPSKSNFSFHSFIFYGEPYPIVIGLFISRDILCLRACSGRRSQKTYPIGGGLDMISVTKIVIYVGINRHDKTIYY